MTPDEFVARMIDALDDALLSSKAKTKSWTSIALMLPATLRTEMNGYSWEVRTTHALNHSILDATLKDGFSSLSASVCFNTLVPESELLSHWHTLHNPTEHHAESQMCMIAMLTLKTSMRIRGVL